MKKSQRIRRGSRAFAAVVAATAGLLAGTAATSGAAGSKTAKELSTPITIGYTTPVADQLIPVITANAGYFEKEGLHVSVEKIESSEINQALISNQIQYAVEAAPAPEIDTADGQPIIWVAQWEQTPNIFLIGRPGIKTMKDLNGKSIAVTTTGAFTDVLAQYATAKSHVTAKIVPLETPPNDLAALESGSVTAAVLPPPLNVEAEKALPGSTVLDNYPEEHIAWPGVGLVATHSFLQKNAAVTERVLGAIASGISYFKGHPNQVKQVIATDNNSTPSETNAAYKDAEVLLVDPPTPSLKDQRSLLTMLVNQKLITGKHISPSEFQDAYYMNHATKAN